MFSIDGISKLEFKVKSTDQFVQSLTWPNPPIDDAELRFALAANETVYFLALLRVWGASAVPGARIMFSGPPGHTVFYGPLDGINVNAAGVFAKRNEHTAGTIIDFVTGHTSGGAWTRAAHIWGVMRNGPTPGQGICQWYQNTAHPDATGVLKDSVLLVIRP